METLVDANIGIDQMVEQAETFCEEEGIELKLVYRLSM